MVFFMTFTFLFALFTVLFSTFMVLFMTFTVFFTTLTVLRAQGNSSEWAQLSSLCNSVRHHEVDGAMRSETFSLSLKGAWVWSDPSRCRLPSVQVDKSCIYIHRGRYFGIWSKYNNGIFSHWSFFYKFPYILKTTLDICKLFDMRY